MLSEVRTSHLVGEVAHFEDASSGRLAQLVVDLGSSGHFAAVVRDEVSQVADDDRDVQAFGRDGVGDDDA